MAMLQLMSDLTDKSSWNVDVFDNTIVAKWREQTFQAQEARVAQGEELKMRVTSERAWDWCILELRDKALAFDEDRFVRLFDAGSADGIEPLLKRPISGRNLETLVDPSLFPLAYEKTSVLTEGQVCLRAAVESFGTGKLSLRQLDGRLNTSEADSRIDAGYADVFESDETDDLRRFLWSSNYQLLPCEVEFSESGTGTDAHITSYINNLHPIHYQSVYYFVEKLISLAIKPWNECLVKGEKARWPIRIRTYSLTWEPEYPRALVDKLQQDPTTEIHKEAIKEAEEFFKLPNRSGSVQPPADLPEDLARYPNILEDMFRDQGLQVIVKIVATAIYFYDVENTTAAEMKISFRQRAYMDQGGYHYNRSDWPAFPSKFEVPREDIESMLGFKEKSNLFALTTQGIGYISAVQGRLITWPSTLQYRFEQATLADSASEIPSSSSPRSPSPPPPSSTPTASKSALSAVPGYCRFVMLSLVDPHYRICSTRNVPPQEHAWWAGEVHNILALCRIPLEVAVMITEMTGGWPVGVDEVRLQQEQLLRERKWAERAFTEIMDYVDFGGEF
ncbi:hypothetical protein V501_01338 [Pseudogymnoascus sp. VKM F-4519 (FW-2642)]|nr:hypothetical protein V501_01338 [Pseudogymnoascus sp. VKM F-4519 (FW-2642)]